MVLYECKECNYVSKIKTQYKRHLKTKKHGVNILNSEKVSYNSENPKNDPQMTRRPARKTVGKYF